MTQLRFLTFAAAAFIVAACSSTSVTAAPASKIVVSERPAQSAASETPASAGAKAKDHHKHHTDQPRPYDAAGDARAEVDNALNAARQSGKMSIIAMGANWCHDSRGLAAQFEKERFRDLLSVHYELVYVDVGQKDRNIEIAQEFGVEKIVGTPTVFVIASNGDVLNLDTAPTWRNADSRSEDDIFDYFESFTTPELAPEEK